MLEGVLETETVESYGHGDADDHVGVEEDGKVDEAVGGDQRAEAASPLVKNYVEEGGDADEAAAAVCVLVVVGVVGVVVVLLLVVVIETAYHDLFQYSPLAIVQLTNIVPFSPFRILDVPTGSVYPVILELRENLNPAHFVIADVGVVVIVTMVEGNTGAVGNDANDGDDDEADEVEMAVVDLEY